MLGTLVLFLPSVRRGTLLTSHILVTFILISQGVIKNMVSDSSRRIKILSNLVSGDIVRYRPNGLLFNNAEGLHGKQLLLNKFHY